MRRSWISSWATAYFVTVTWVTKKPLTHSSMPDPGTGSPSIHVRALPESEMAGLFEDAGLAIARRIPSTLGYELEAWMAHGAPAEAARQEIVRLMESCLAEDRAGLRVRREGERLYFTHQAAVFVLESTPRERI